mgnify:FL=1
MWNKPSDEELAQIPPLYSSENIPIREIMIHMHFFIGGSDWYAAEYNPEERIFFGFVILNEDYEMAEWGHFGLNELCDIKVSFLEIDRDLHFIPTKAENIENIKKAQRW